MNTTEGWWDTLQGLVSSQAEGVSSGVSSQFLRERPPEVEGVSSQIRYARAHDARTRAGGEESEETSSTSGRALRKNCEETHAESELTSLLAVIRLGCQKGLGQRLPAVSAERTGRLLATIEADGADLGAVLQACRAAGPATTLAAAIALYEQLLADWEHAGADMFAWHGALALAVAHKPQRRAVP